jgi:hypothetical protein
VSTEVKVAFKSFLSLAVASVLATGLISDAPAQRGGRIFNHNTTAHKQTKDGKPLECSYCHSLPTSNWQQPRPDKETPFPDVRSYPFNKPGSKPRETHTACFSCHTGDLYSNGGAFCAGCHTVAGPGARGGAGLKAFPNAAHPTQFSTTFPHDLHQDILAALDPQSGVAVAHFVNASYSGDTKKPEFYNCSVCHQTAAKLPRYDVRLPVTDEKPPKANADAFLPKAQFFKDVPSGHADCFICHYQRTPPISTDCAGCHRLESKSPTVSNVVERSSLKFDHEQAGIKVQVGERVHAKDCITCHLRTSASSDLQMLKTKAEPEVPFSTCVSCHVDDFKTELKKRDDNRAYQCAYCHTTALGRYKMPDSHHE